MARLNIEQVAAPNFSASAQLLAGAGQSLNQGLSAASTLLDKYATGQQAKGDAALTQAMIGVSDEAGIADFLANNDLSQMNLSPEMMAAARNLRDTTIGYAQGRADVNQTQTQTGVLQSNEDRTASDWAYGNTRRDELAGVASQYAGALAEGQQYGNTPTFSAAVDRTESGGGGDQYDTLYGHRNRSNGVSVSSMTLGELRDFSSPSGEYGQSVNSEIGRIATPMGKFQIVGTTLRGIQEDLGLPDDVTFTPAVQELMGTYLGQRRVAQGGSDESLRAGLRSEWAGFDKASDEELDAIIVELRNTPPVSRDQIIAASSNGGQASKPITSNPNMTPAAQALMQSVAENSTMTLDDVNSIFTGINAATDRGQGQIDQAEGLRVQNVQAQASLDALNGDSITPGGAVSAGANAGETAGLSPTQILDGMNTTRDVVTTNADILTPSVAVDPLVAAADDSNNRTMQRDLDALPQTRLIKTADRYGDDAVGGLIEDLGLGADGEDPRSYVFGLFGEDADTNTLRRHINTIAEQAGVTPAMAAAAMADEFIRDPLGVNLTKHRFDPQSVISYLQATVGPEGMQAYEGALVEQQTTKARSEAAQLQLQTLQTQLAKTTDPNRQRQLQAQIEELSTNVTTADVQGPAPTADAQLQAFLQSSDEDFARQLSQTTPGSEEHSKILRNMIQVIEYDPQMSEMQKTLLISRIQG